MPWHIEQIDHAKHQIICFVKTRNQNMSLVDIMRTAFISFQKSTQLFFKVLLQPVMQITSKTFTSFFRKGKNSFFSFYSFCCNKMFSVSFLSVSSCFQISFKNLLPNKQTKIGRKIIHEWKVFYLNCDVKNCKNCIPFQNVQKLCEGEQKTAHLV